VCVYVCACVYVLQCVFEKERDNVREDVCERERD